MAADGFEQPLQEELGERVLEQHGRFFLYFGQDPVWAQNLWLDCRRLSFKSISEAAKTLRAVQRNWWLYSVAAHRRAELIREQLPPLKSKAIEFAAQLPTAPLGSWTLLSDTELLYSPACSSKFPNGEVSFIENKTGPPSRAYLKLWEFLTVEARLPQKAERVIDLGSSPGGWTWVLDQLGCDILSVDKAPLAPEMKLSNRVRFINESAFGLDPKAMGALDWLFCDIICYPERLFELVEKWDGVARNMVCTIKFQGPTDFTTLNRFRAIPNSKIQHLHHNKHELTWSRILP